MATNIVGLLVVHGIGEQRPGETSQKLIAGLRRAFGGDIEVSNRRKAPPQAETRQSRDHAELLPESIELSVRGFDRTLVLYEVYWADLMAGEKAAGSFQMRQLIALPWMRQQNTERGLYGNVQPQFLPREESLLLLYFISTCAYYGYYGLRQAVSLIGMLWHTLLAVLFVLLIPTVTLSRLVAFLPGMRKRVAAYHTALAALILWNRRGLAAAPPGGRHPVDVLLDGYVGDILSYVNTQGRQFFVTNVPDWNAGTGILKRFHDRLQQACDECDEVHLLAHSLGSVIAYHGITGYGLPPSEEHACTMDLLTKLKGMYTFGSPIGKFRYFWPLLVGYRPTRVVIENGTPVRAASTGEVIACDWLNFYNPLDLVSGKLTPQPGFPPPINIRVLESGLIFSHVRYEQNEEFLDAIAPRLFGRGIKSKTVRAGTMSRLVESLKESLAGMGGFAFLVALGVATQFGVLWLLSKGIGELVGLFAPDAVPWVPSMVWIVGFALSLVFTAGSGLHLAKLQASNWALWKESETPAPSQAAAGVRRPDQSRSGSPMPRTFSGS
jgi:hypothetical protein